MKAERIPWNKGLKTNLRPGNFKDEGVSYSGIHHWVKYHLGRPIKCADCGLDEIPEGKKRYFEWANLSGEYLRDLDDWIPLCVKCHRKKDDVIAKSWLTRKERVNEYIS